MPTIATAPAGRPIFRDQTIAGQLNQEWERLLVDPAGNEAVRRWGSEPGPLHGVTGLDDMVARLHGPGSRDVHDRLLYALLGLTRTGPDRELATRILLQRMLPRAIRLGTSPRFALYMGNGSHDPGLVLAVSSLYEVIRTYPMRRASNVAANIAMDTLAVMRRAFLAERRSELVEPGHLDNTGSDRDLGSRPETSASERLAHLLIWAVSNQHLDRDTATLLADRYLGHAAGGNPNAVVPFEEIAARRGLSAAALRQRCSRAIRRLQTHAAQFPELDHLIAA